MFKRLMWKIRWNKKLILKGTAIAAVPLLGVSAFMGYWFMKPTEQSVPSDGEDDLPDDVIPPDDGDDLPDEGDDLPEEGEPIQALEIESVDWYTNQQIIVDYEYSSEVDYISQVVVEYGYDGVYVTEELSKDEESSFFILNNVPQETNITIDIRTEYFNGYTEYEETYYLTWEDNPGYYNPKPDVPAPWQPGTPQDPSNPEDPEGIKDPITYTPVDPISTSEFYVATTSEGKYEQEFVEAVLLSNFGDMIDTTEPGISPNAEYELYYEIVGDNILNIMVVETIDGQVLNETKYTYSIV